MINLVCPSCKKGDGLAVIVERYIERDVTKIFRDEDVVEYDEALDNPDFITTQRLVGWKCTHCGIAHEQYGTVPWYFGLSEAVDA